IAACHGTDRPRNVGPPRRDGQERCRLVADGLRLSTRAGPPDRATSQDAQRWQSRLTIVEPVEKNRHEIAQRARRTQRRSLRAFVLFCVFVVRATPPLGRGFDAQSQLSVPDVWYSVTRVSKKFF